MHYRHFSIGNIIILYVNFIHKLYRCIFPNHRITIILNFKKTLKFKNIWNMLSCIVAYIILIFIVDTDTFYCRYSRYRYLFEVNFLFIWIIDFFLKYETFAYQKLSSYFDSIHWLKPIIYNPLLSPFFQLHF